MSDQAVLNAPQSVNTIELNAQTNSKISHINLYGSRAEVVRIFKFEAPAGQNNVNITELPSIIHNSLRSVVLLQPLHNSDGLSRVDGKGAATIHDVTPTSKHDPGKPSDSLKLKDIAAQRQSLNEAMERAKKRLGTLNSYLDRVNTEHTPVSELRSILDLYEEEAGKLQGRMKEIQSELELVTESEREEIKAHPPTYGRWVYGATIGLFVPEAATLQLILTYGLCSTLFSLTSPKLTPFTAVYNAFWSALYDVRVSMNKTNKPVELVYKAAITQSTGESWDDVPIILETATPTDNVTVPKLDLWRVSVYAPPPPRLSPVIVLDRHSRSRSRSRPRTPTRYRSRSWSRDEDMGFGDEPVYQSAPAPRMAVASTVVVSQGNITATFRVPGRTTVPSDGAVHSVTIAKLDLDAVVEWVAVPKKDPRTHLKVKRLLRSTYPLH